MEENLPNNIPQSQVSVEVPVNPVNTVPQAAPKNNLMIIAVIFLVILITGGAALATYFLMNKSISTTNPVKKPTAIFHKNTVDLTPTTSPSVVISPLPTATPYENPFTATVSADNANPFANVDNPFNNLQ